MAMVWPKGHGEKGGTGGGAESKEYKEKITSSTTDENKSRKVLA